MPPVLASSCLVQMRSLHAQGGSGRPAQLRAGDDRLGDCSLASPPLPPHDLGKEDLA